MPRYCLLGHVDPNRLDQYREVHHAVWPELLEAIKSAEAETVYVTHGFSEEVVRYLNETGTNAVPLKTQFVGDDAAEIDE